MRHDPYSLWCIVKKVPIRTAPVSNAEVVEWLQFGQKVVRQRKPVSNGYAKVECRFGNGGKKIYFTGWVSVKALSHYEVIDCGLLYYDNITGNRLPVKSSYYSERVTGFIDPGESVVVAAKVGSWCLTNRGWTRYEWLSKSRYIFDQSVIDSLLYEALSWAVKDYRSIVRRIIRGRYKDNRDFCNLVDDLDDLGVFFLDRSNAMNIDKVPGDERLAMLNKELGIDNAWLKEQLDKRDMYRQRKRKRKA